MPFPIPEPEFLVPLYRSELEHLITDLESEAVVVHEMGDREDCYAQLERAAKLRQRHLTKEQSEALPVAHGMNGRLMYGPIHPKALTICPGHAPGVAGFDSPGYAHQPERNLWGAMVVAHDGEGFYSAQRILVQGEIVNTDAAARQALDQWHSVLEPQLMAEARAKGIDAARDFAKPGLQRLCGGKSPYADLFPQPANPRTGKPAANPIQQRTQATNPALTTAEYFGGCPTCGKTDGYVNFGADHWFVCDEHETRWYIGSNLFSGWRDNPDTEATLKRVAQYAVVETVHANPAP